MLCRILTELKLLNTSVGIITLAAGVSNDVVGWILLALCVALVNAGSGLTALWVVLTCVAYALFSFLAVRPVFLWYLRRHRAIQDGPSQSVMVVTLLVVLTSSFFTGVIGVHPIFGAFVAGLICPHEGGFAIKMTEKIEDLVGALFLPLYFALSGLSTNIGLLDNGITWAYVVGVIAIAFIAKFVGGTLGARVNGLVWRESFTIGALMSCKGLVELIVLNIGLQARILSTRTFTIFVVMALVTTFATTPLVQALYPPWYQRKIEAWKRGEIDWDTGKPVHDDGDADAIVRQKEESAKIKTLLVYLRLDNMPTLLALVSLLGNKMQDGPRRDHPSKSNEKKEGPQYQPAVHDHKRVAVHGVRLVELTDRGSSVMKVSEADEYSLFDPILNAFRVLGQLFNLTVSGEVAIIPEASFAETLVNKAVEESSDLLLIPWSETGTLSEKQTVSTENVKNKLASDQYSAFVRETLDSAQCHAAVFINKSFSGTLKQRSHGLHRTLSALSVRSQREHLSTLSVDQTHHIFMPFFGLSADDRVALRLVLQLVENPGVTATIVYYESITTSPSTTTHEIITTKSADAAESKQPVSVSSSTKPSECGAFFTTIQKSIPSEISNRVLFETVRNSQDPIKDALIQAQEELAQNPKNGGDLVIIGRHAGQFRKGGGGGGNPIAGQETLGCAADAIAMSGTKASLLVVQARGGGSLLE